MMNMRKGIIAGLLAVGMSVGGAQAGPCNNFTMIDAGPATMGGTNDVNFTWDGTYNTAVAGAVTNGTLSSDEPFAGVGWTAHDVKIYAPGTYTIDTVQGGVINPTVGAGQIGVHILFDWLVTFDIDVFVVWDMNAAFGPFALWEGADNGIASAGGVMDGCANLAADVWDATSIDWDGDGTNGGAMVDGAFLGFSANFNVNGISADTTPPVVSLVGYDNPMNISVGGIYTEPVASVSDVGNSCIPAVPLTPVVGGDTVDPDTIGTYNVTYTATDCFGNTDVETLVVNVVGEGPAITLAGEAEMSVLLGSSFTDLGATCEDEFDVEYPVTVGGETVDVNTLKENPGYIITYDCTDGIQDAEQKTREVEVIDNNPPVITVDGTDPATAECGGTYTDTGASCADLEDGTLQTVDVNNVVIGTVGAYTVDYTCTDNDGAEDTDSRAVNVVDTTIPVITRSGAEIVEVKKDDPYTDDGATCIDSCDEGLTVTVDNPVDTSIEDTYTVTYTCTDGANNAASQVYRTVEVGGCEIEGTGANDNNNFTMFDPTGNLVGGSTTVLFEWDGTLNVWALPDPMPEGKTEADYYVMTASTDGVVTNPVKNARIETDCPFFGIPWFADPVYFFGPGTYEFNPCPEPIDADGVAADGSTECQNPKNMVMVIGGDQVGAHMLFTWGVVPQIDMINIFDLGAPNPGAAMSADCGAVDQNQVWDLASTDIEVDGEKDGTTGSPFIDGAFVGFSGNMFLNLSKQADQTNPILEISGDNPLVLAVGDEFTCPDAVAVDVKDGELCDNITVVGCDKVDTDTPGGYTVTYEVIDSNGNLTAVDLLVIVIGDGAPKENHPNVVPGTTANHPTIVLNEVAAHPLSYVCGEGAERRACTGNDPGDVISGIVVNYLVGTDENFDTVCDDYEDPGAAGFDLQDGALAPGAVVVTGYDPNNPFNFCAPGTYTITYTVTDNGGNPDVGVTALAAEGALVTTTTRTIQVNEAPSLDRGAGLTPDQPQGSSAIGCSASDKPVNPMNRVDLLLIGAFLAMLGIGRMKRSAE